MQDSKNKNDWKKEHPQNRMFKTPGVHRTFVKNDFFTFNDHKQTNIYKQMSMNK